MDSIAMMRSVLTRDEYQIDDDPGRVDVDALWDFLSTEAYWGRWRTRSDLEKQLANSWRVAGCYGPDGAMVGFARAISDATVTAYLADVYVLSEHRGHGLGQALVQEVVENGAGAGFRWMLHTADAHGLYAKFGFAAPPATYLERPSSHDRPG